MSLWWTGRPGVLWFMGSQRVGHDWAAELKWCMMWELDYKESWVPKNWCFELWCWRRHLRVPLTARRSNQSILKEVNPEYTLEGLLLKLKLKYFGHLMRGADSLEKTPDVAKYWRQGEKGATEEKMVVWHHRLNVHEFKQALGDGEGQGSLGCGSPWGCKVSHNWTTSPSIHHSFV